MQFYNVSSYVPKVFKMIKTGQFAQPNSILLGSVNGTLTLVNLQGELITKNDKMHTDTIVDISQCGMILITTDSKGKIVIWDVTITKVYSTTQLNYPIINIASITRQIDQNNIVGTFADDTTNRANILSQTIQTTLAITIANFTSLYTITQYDPTIKLLKSYPTPSSPFFLAITPDYLILSPSNGDLIFLNITSTSPINQTFHTLNLTHLQGNNIQNSVVSIGSNNKTVIDFNIDGTFKTQDYTNFTANITTVNYCIDNHLVFGHDRWVIYLGQEIYQLFDWQQFESFGSKIVAVQCLGQQLAGLSQKGLLGIATIDHSISLWLILGCLGAGIIFVLFALVCFVERKRFVQCFRVCFPSQDNTSYSLHTEQQIHPQTKNIIQTLRPVPGEPIHYIDNNPFIQIKSYRDQHD